MKKRRRRSVDCARRPSGNTRPYCVWRCVDKVGRCAGRRPGTRARRPGPRLGPLATALRLRPGQVSPGRAPAFRRPRAPTCARARPPVAWPRACAPSALALRPPQGPSCSCFGSWLWCGCSGSRLGGHFEVRRRWGRALFYEICSIFLFVFSLPVAVLIFSH